MARTAGSKNRPKKVIEAERAEKAQANRGRGRPAGSRNKLQKRNANKTADRALIAHRESATIYKPKTEEDMDYNSRLIRHIMQINELSTHADKHDLVSLRSCFIGYLKLCQENGFSVSNLAAYASMGFDFQTFAMFSKKDDPEVREFCTQVKKTCAMFRESLVKDGKLNPVIGIFWQRNFDGLRNDTEVVQTALEMDESYVSGSKAYKDKYKNLIGE